MRTTTNPNLSDLVEQMQSQWNITGLLLEGTEDCHNSRDPHCTLTRKRTMISAMSMKMTAITDISAINAIWTHYVWGRSSVYGSISSKYHCRIIGQSVATKEPHLLAYQTLQTMIMMIQNEDDDTDDTMTHNTENKRLWQYQEFTNLCPKGILYLAHLLTLDEDQWITK